MLTLTRIGMIDTGKKHNVEFALIALDYQLSVSVELNYDLYKEECEALSLHAHQDVNELINEIMWLKLSTQGQQCNKGSVNLIDLEIE